MNKFIPSNFDDDDLELLRAAVRLTLRWALSDPDSEIDDPNSSSSLYQRIEDLLAAWANSEAGWWSADDAPRIMLLAFAAEVAMTIAQSPSLRAALATHLAATPDNDP